MNLAVHTDVRRADNLDSREIAIGAPAGCADGPCGQCVSVVVDPHTDRLTHLVIAESQPPRAQRLVALDEVVETGPHRILLRCTRDRLRTMAEFVETQLVQSDALAIEEGARVRVVWPLEASLPLAVLVEHRHVPPGELELSRRTRVLATDGPVGHIDDLRVENNLATLVS